MKMKRRLKLVVNCLAFEFIDWDQTSNEILLRQQNFPRRTTKSKPVEQITQIPSELLTKASTLKTHFTHCVRSLAEKVLMM